MTIILGKGERDVKPENRVTILPKLFHSMKNYADGRHCRRVVF